VKKLNEEINKILAAPELREKFSAEALNVMPMTPPQFGQYIAGEIAHWTAVARASKIEANSAINGNHNDPSATLRLGAARGGVSRGCRPRFRTR